MENNYLKLNKYIRFRREKHFVLLTNCFNMENYFFPSWTYKYLITLRKGLVPLKTNKNLKLLISDLKCISALDSDYLSSPSNIFEKIERF